MSTLRSIYGVNVIFSLHAFLIMYLNSSLLSSVLATRMVNLLYAASSAASLGIIIYLPRILERYGMRRTVFFTLIAEFVAVLGLGLVSQSYLIALLFVVHQTLVLAFIFLFDILLESVSSDSNTGTIRATFLTLSNITLVMSPAIIGLWSALHISIGKIYILSALLVIPLFFVFSKRLRDIRSHKALQTESLATILKHNFDIRNIVLTRLILESFYAAMVIYTPIYLSVYLDYTWRDIGFIFTIMLLPFVIFEIPAGIISDRKIGEKELLIAGMLIMGVATMIIPFLGYGSILLWSLLLFVTRIGASIVEVETESYFFKKVNENNTGVISAFRSTRPLSYIVVPVAASILLLIMPFKFLFFVLGLGVGLGALAVIHIKDTK